MKIKNEEKRKIRVQALENLYEMEFQNKREVQPAHLKLETTNLVNGVKTNQKKIDKLLVQHSQNWKIDRMDLLDLNILRIATYEIIFKPNESSKIFINEAIELAKIYGSENSSKFINGILDSISKTKEIK